MTRLHVAGVALRGSGYPNAEQTIRLLQASDAWQVEDRARWLPEDVHLWRIARGPLPGRLALLCRLMFGNAIALWRLARVLRSNPGLTYVPYPAAFLLWWVSWLPTRWRPRIVADAYISLWDSAFRDRAGDASGGLVSRLAKAFEGRALRAAEVVLVDTAANRDWMLAEFMLDPARVRAIPLAIDGKPFLALSRKSPPGQSAPLRVLFVGTFIPLHGIRVLADTIRWLGPECGIEFHLVGDGQEAGVIEALMHEAVRAPVEWERGWLPIDEIAARMARADVCLGVFGGEGKAARVLPFKLYMALAAGMPITTQRSHSLPADVPQLPVDSVDPCPKALAAALLALHADPMRLDSQGRASRNYYLRWLGADAISSRWAAIAASLAQHNAS